jgi:KaiC/GvpD/RAD55 family RecA-like ATPase
MKSLLVEAEELERKYEWGQAAKFYKKIESKLHKDKNIDEVAQLQERLGYSYYRAALRAQNNIEFQKFIKLAIQSYEKMIQILGLDKERKNQVKIKHAEALVAYTMSWFVTTPNKRKNLLAKWWIIENQILTEYENDSDLVSIGKTCNDLLEMSFYNWFWFYSDHSEWERKTKKLFSLAEKAIKIFYRLNNKEELARAYCFASWYHSFSDLIWKSQDKVNQLNQKSQEYANEALKLSQNVGEAWLLSWSNITAHLTSSTINPAIAKEYGERAARYANITKDNFLLSYANASIGTNIMNISLTSENPEKQKKELENSVEIFKESTYNSQIINHFHGIGYGYYFQIIALAHLASMEINPNTKKMIFEKINGLIQKGVDQLGEWNNLFGILDISKRNTLHLLSKFKSDNEEKKVLLQKAQSYAMKAISHSERRYRYAYLSHSDSYNKLSSIQSDLARLEIDKAKKIELLNKAVISIEKSLLLVEKKAKVYLRSEWTNGVFGQYHQKLAGILTQLYFITKKEKEIDKALKADKKAKEFFEKADMPIHVAESYWHSAQLYDQMERQQVASQNYELASQAYDLATAKIPQLKRFYKDYSLYMKAWSQIEQARYNHSIENYDKARQHYEKSAKLHESTDQWSYLAPKYFAWANMEEAESLSRSENTQQAKQTFQKALEQFAKAEESIKLKLGEINSAEEKELVKKLLEASDLRRIFCKARIQIEDAKLLDRKGKYLQSSKSYEEAAQNIQSIVEKVESKAERKEMKYLAILCQAWEKMARAEETASSGSYLEAAKLFEKAKEYCYTKKASLWTLGNSSFCKGLAAKNQFQSTFKKSYHSMANKQVEQAADYYGKAGFQAASEHAKATQRLLDAYVYIHSAQEEVDPEKKTKFYQLSEHLLQLAAGLFMKAKQPEKTSEIQRILLSVREEKALAASLNEVMHAPTITSSTMSFAAPSPTNETSVGLKQFQHANVQANLIAGKKEIKIGESFCLTVEFVNAGKEPALLTRVEDFVHPDFLIVKKPEIYCLEETCLNMKGKQIAPLKLVEAKVMLQPSIKGVYQLSPTVHYLDERGQNKSLQLKSVEIKVEEVRLADRISTGTRELDSLLLGGIPEEYAVVLTGSPSDERELIIRNFLEAETGEGQTSFYVTTEAIGIENLLRKKGFHLFLCNPKPKVEVPNLPNVYKLRGKTDLTNLNITLLKAYRNIEQSSNKRVCLDIVSDVLLRYGAEVTRRWISELITDMCSKGFTILAVLDPEMHPPDQAKAIINLFDGEISLAQTEDPLECRKSLRIKKLRNQDYIKNPICLTKL